MPETALHRLLKRQLAAATAPDGTVDYSALLRDVSAAYESADNDYDRTDRSIRLTTEDNERLNSKLRDGIRSLELQNGRFDAAIESMGHGLAMFDEHGSLAVANQQFGDIYGIDRAQLAPGTRLDQLARAVLAGGLAIDQAQIEYGLAAIATLTPGQTVTGVSSMADGRIIDVVTTKLHNGGWVTTHTDVTQGRQAEAAIAEAETRWNFALESAGQGVWDSRLATGDTFYSPIWREMRGLSMTEDAQNYATQWSGRLHPEDRDRAIAAVQAQARGEFPETGLEYRERHKDGHWMWILTRAKPVAWGSDGLPTRIIGTDTDVTRFRETQAALVEAEARWNLALEGSDQGVWDSNQITGVKYYSPVWRKMRGIDPLEKVDSDTETWLARVHIDDRDRLREIVRKQGSGEVTPSFFEYRELRRDGQWIWIQSRGEPVSWDKDGIPTRVVGIDTDITARKELELQAAQSLQRLNTTLENFPGGICMFDKDLVLTVANRGLYELTQLDEHWFPVGSTLQDIHRFHASRGEYGDGDIDALVAERMADIQTVTPSKFYHTRPQDNITLEFTRIPLEQGGYILMVDDITEKLAAEQQKAQLERELSHAQKMESLGTLASGVAHEINTPIQYVGDNIRFAQNSFSDLVSLLHKCRAALAAAGNPEAIAEIERDEKRIDLEFLLGEVPQSLTQSLEGISQVATIVKAIKEFSHPGQEEAVDTDLNAVIETTLVVSRNQWKYVAEVEVDLDATLPLVTCHPGDINQVVLNLVVNAAQAIGEHPQNGPGRIQVSTKRSNGCAEIVVQDNGCGIPPDMIKRVFDPFFTTKDVGKGTGQGLAICFAIITQKHHGTIDCVSTPGEGTTFRIRLPLTTTAAADIGKVA